MAVEIIRETLSKWGNSQGVRIPKSVCSRLGAEVGDPVELKVDEAKGQVIVAFEFDRREYQRNRKVSMEELCAGWDGGKVGEEWGGPDVGAEVVA